MWSPSVLRLCSPRLLASISARNPSALTSPMSTVMRPMPASEHKTQREEFFAKNERMGRPTSPHLTIYSPQMTSMLSITHRGTGVVMSCALSGFAIGVMLLPSTFPQFLDTLQSYHFGPALIFAAKMTLAWPLAFHMLNGCRHLAWDLGHGFKLPELYKTGYAVLFASIVLSIVIAQLH